MKYRVKRISKYYQREFGVREDLSNSGFKRTYKKYVGRLRRGLAEKIRDSIDKDLDENKQAHEELKRPNRQRLNNPEAKENLKRRAGDLGVEVSDIDTRFLKYSRSDSPYNAAIVTLTKGVPVFNETMLENERKVLDSQRKNEIRNNVKEEDCLDTIEDLEEAIKSEKEGKRINNLARELKPDSRIKRVAVVPKRVGDESLGHELGHRKNELGGGISEKIHKSKNRVEGKRRIISDPKKIF